MKSRKELKDEYKQLKPRVGVFQIKNIRTGKIYISSSQALDTILNSQKFQLEMNGHRNEALQKEWNEYGPESFEFEILHELKIPDDTSYDIRKEMKDLEAIVIEEVQPFGEQGYHKKK
jgi:hypothetical protein